MPAGVTIPVGSLISPGGQQGVPGPAGAPGGVGQVIFLNAAHNFLPSESGRYAICSGGSWTLGLPAPATGLSYYVRNDMGIVFGTTTGTITITPASGTIDGLASLNLLPGQEAMILTDGVNWRTFARHRVVVLGTIDISGSPTTINLLLPLGYREFELDVGGLTCASGTPTLFGYFSNNGGASWDTAAHYAYDLIYNNTTTAATSQQANQTYSAAFLGPLMYPGSVPGSGKISLYPGTAAIYPSWVAINGGYGQSVSMYQNYYVYGWDPLTGPINAVQLFCSGNQAFAGGQITVKGIV